MQTLFEARTKQTKKTPSIPLSWMALRCCFLEETPPWFGRDLIQVRQGFPVHADVSSFLKKQANPILFITLKNKICNLSKNPAKQWISGAV